MLVRSARIGAPLVALVASLVTWPWMPDPMPIHWGLDGQPDGFAPRAFGLLVLPAFALAIPWAIAAATSRDRKMGPRARAALELTLAATATLLSAIHGLALVAAVSSPQTISLGWITALLGGFFVVLGAAMHDIEPNRWIGVRTPTTLSNPAIWKVVHEKTSVAFIAAGVLAVLAAATLPGSIALLSGIAAALAVSVGSVIFAWMLGRARG